MDGQTTAIDSIFLKCDRRHTTTSKGDRTMAPKVLFKPTLVQERKKKRKSFEIVEYVVYVVVLYNQRLLEKKKS